jgi:hypothetical protein
MTARKPSKRYADVLVTSKRNGKNLLDIITPKRRKYLDLFKGRPVIAVQDINALLESKNETHVRYVNRVLGELVDLGYLVRKWVTVLRPSGRFGGYYAYGLDKKGRDEVHGKAITEQASSSAEHDAVVTSFMTMLSAVRKVHIIEGNLKRTVYPDKCFGLESKNAQWFWFFLEVERKRQSLSRTDHKGMIARLKEYDTYRRTDGCKADWKFFSDFRVIVETDTEELKWNFLKRVAHQLPYSWIWVASVPEVRRDLTGPIFHTPKDFSTKAYSLNDI